MKKEFLIKILFFLALMIIGYPLCAQFPGRFNGENQIIISGKSNIQDFVVRYYFKKRLKVVFHDSTDCSDTQKSVIQIPVHKLLFSNHHMKDDFLNLFQANKYPYIRLFYNPELLGWFGKKKNKTVPIVIQITDVKRTYRVPVSLLKKDGSLTKLKGRVQIRLSDFKLTPKRYFFGIIHLKDLLNINFILYFYRRNT